MFYLKAVSHPDLSKRLDLNTPIQIYINVWEALQNTAQMYTQNSCCNIVVAAAAVTEQKDSKAVSSTKD